MPRKGENVYHRKDGLWEARYVKGIDSNGKKIKGSVYAKSCKEVKEKRQLMIDSVRLNIPRPVTRNSTLGNVVEEWLALNESRLKLSTIQKYNGLYNNHIKPSLGDRPLIYLTTVSINDFTKELIASGFSSVSVNMTLTFLHSCLKYAHKQYGFAVPDIVYLPNSKKEMRVLSEEEQKRVLDYLLENMDIYKFGIILALYTGMRVGELCGLEWEDVMEDRLFVRRTVQRVQKPNEKGTVLHIGTPKTPSSQREIPIPSFLKETIETFRHANGDSEYVLSLNATGPIEPRTMQKHLADVFKATGIQGATFHTLRHTFATRCVECNFELKSLAAILGHSSVKTTLDRYVHASLKLKASNMEKLKTYFSPKN